MSARVVLVVGHGGVPKDFPKDEVAELARLEKARQARGGAPTPREAELNAKIRAWPRTPATEPYKFGVDAIVARLQARLPGARVVACYNEFCAPSLEEALDDAAAAGAERVDVVTVMLTPGGYHSEIEIPRMVRAAKAKHPGTSFEYLWPFDLDGIAGFLAGHLETYNPEKTS